MELKVFKISASGGGLMEEEINKFLRSHRIIQVTKQFSPDGGGYWTFCIEYSENDASSGKPFGKKEQKDATEDLSAEEKERYEKYRTIRKRVASELGFPAYNIFYNEELAQIAKLPVVDASVAEIEGVAPSRIRDYLKYFYTEVDTQNIQQNATAGQQSDGRNLPF
ncbi:MAG: HRDC domain-containing protein [Bacteroidales bacterium]|nr:HRDC domain-containing protein [Bacteroidales bacterium]